MTEQTPTVGRIVHYTSRGSADGIYPPETRAAIITAVRDNAGDLDTLDGDPIVSLCVLNPTGMFFDIAVTYNAEPLPGCWSWPPRT